jgi:hypothetical protein
MKNTTTLVALTTILVAILLVSILNPSSEVVAKRLSPTSVPTATEGPPPTTAPSVSIALDHPLTREEAVQVALEYDRRVAARQTDWSFQTLTAEPERITVEWYKDRSYDGSEPGEGVENGPIWVVTIKGNVQVQMDRQNAVRGWISYAVSQNTGVVWGFQAGSTRYKIDAQRTRRREKFFTPLFYFTTTR